MSGLSVKRKNCFSNLSIPFFRSACFLAGIPLKIDHSSNERFIRLMEPTATPSWIVTLGKTTQHAPNCVYFFNQIYPPVT